MLTDSAFRTVDYVQDGEGNLTDVLLPESGTLRYEYEDPYDPHNATLLTDSSCASCGGSAFENVYDAFDRVMSQTHGDHVLEFDYSSIVLNRAKQHPRSSRSS